MARVSDIAQNAIGLIQIERHPKALELIERSIHRVRRFAEWQTLLTVFDHLPEGLLEQPGWGTVYSRTLVGVREAERLLDFAPQFLARHSLQAAANTALDQAWALILGGRFGEAVSGVEAALPYLEPSRQGVAYHRLGLARFELRQSGRDDQDWQGAFVEARGLLSGRPLGLALLDEGACWQRWGDGSQARAVWREALAQFPADPYFQAWLFYNLGDSAMRDGLLEAEDLFRQAELLTRRKGAAALRPRAFQGLATFYRSRGEWPIAEATYQKAIKAAREPDDRAVAYWSLARCYRLMGKPRQAVIAITKAQAAHPNSKSAIHLERAAILLTMADKQGAVQGLSSHPKPTGQNVHLAAIVKAELLRQSSDPHNAIQTIHNLPKNALVVQEEAMFWSELFALAKSEELPVPEPLNYVQRLTIRVHALGALKVWVNERPVQISSRVGELLVLLLENRRKALGDYLIRYLWPGSDAQQKHQALWQLVRELRHTLGWHDSVRVSRKMVHLSPKVVWDYDVDKARVKGAWCRHFLEEVNSTWAVEVRQDLERIKKPNCFSSQKPDCT